ncbi:ankyrin repeat-containing protein [Fusarium tjaetaba]|uniref:Ankyrin repeat-containing protein n=1 Tax=Fusarium tjaetaba TaxID=1567544 RepID=A0A8H5RHL3_9HYPO|nr:ankyrin repeat-containing protein [Fusarium tjaetaba]KAF5633314.1 ankyrin repeat-containing protein [Fusarium tjaetaba]
MRSETPSYNIVRAFQIPLRIRSHLLFALGDLILIWWPNQPQRRVARRSILKTIEAAVLDPSPGKTLEEWGVQHLSSLTSTAVMWSIKAQNITGTVLIYCFGATYIQGLGLILSTLAFKSYLIIKHFPSGISNFTPLELFILGRLSLASYPDKSVATYKLEKDSLKTFRRQGLLNTARRKSDPERRRSSKMAGLVDSTNNEGQDKGRTPLACAAEAGHIVTVAKLLAGSPEFNIDIDARDYDGCTPLTIASQKGHTAVVEQLLAHGANPNFRDFNQITPLWHAARHGHTPIVHLLLNSRQISDVNSRPICPQENRLDTPLSIAIKKGHQETAELLSRTDGINPCLRTGLSAETYWDNLSILGLAIRSAFEDVALALLDKCNLGHDNEDADSGDDGSCVEDSDENFSCASGSDIDGCDAENSSSEGVDGYGTDGSCAEYSDAKDSNAEGSAGKNYDNHIFDSNGTKEPMEPVSKLLVLAVVASCSRIVQELLTTYCADVNATHSYYAGEALSWVKDSPLMAASRRGDLNTVHLLLGLDEIRPGVSSDRSDSALAAAAQGGFLDVDKTLVANGRIEVDCKNEEGRTALSLAAESGFEAVVAELLATGAADPNSQDNKGRTPLIWATDPTGGYGPGGWQLREGVINRLLANDQTVVNTEDSEDQTALLYAAKNGALGLVVALLGHPEIDSMGGSAIWSPLGEAATKGHADVAQTLLAKGRVDVNTVCDLFGSTALMLMAGCCDAEDDVSTAQVLLSAPEIDVDFQDDRGKTALMGAASRGAAGMVKLLLASGADPNMQDHDGNTAISHVRKIEIMKALLEAPGIKPDHPNNEGRTALSLAAEAANIECVNGLLSIEDVNPDARDIYGRGPLSWVFEKNGLQYGWAREERKEVLQQLLRIPTVDPNAEDNYGSTPLLLAIMSDHGNEYVEVLLSRPDLDVNQPPIEGTDSPLDTAMKIGNMDTVALLRARGATDSVESVKPRSSGKNFVVDEGGSPSGRYVFEYIPPQQRHRRSLSQESGTSSTSFEPDYDHRPFVTHGFEGVLRWELLREHRLRLGQQQTYIDELAKSTTGICASCSAIDLGSVFWTRHTDYRGRVIADLGRVDETWKKRSCPLCRLFATVYPRTSLREGHKLVSFSTIQSWLCHAEKTHWLDLRYKRFVDTMLLAVVPASTLVAGEVDPVQSYSWCESPPGRDKDTVKAAFSSGVIGRLGSNGPSQGAVTIMQLGTEIIDWSIARNWIKHWGSQTGDPPPYVALSYVWGKSQGSQQSAKQKQQDSLGRKGDGSVDPTIEDAMSVTLELGYTYLWVDRYCVVQEGNEAVKQEQLRHMHLVYANAEVTLIAAAGEDSSAGLRGVPGRPRNRQPSAFIQGHALASIPPDPSHHVGSNSTWATRAWTYQEGLLARRRLYFSEHEMSYECRNMLCREAIRLPRGFEQRISGHKPRFMEPFWMYQPYRLPGMDTSHTGIGLFDLLAVYSKRQLTLESDTLNAMLGIFNLVAQHKTRPIYHICGVPILRLDDPRPGTRNWGQRKTKVSGDNCGTDINPAVSLGGFVDGLCWRLEETAHRRPGFPSWSWTGWQGVVTGAERHMDPIKQTYGFAIEVSIIPDGREHAVAVPWSRCYNQLRMVDKSDPDIRTGQKHILEITASAATVRFRKGEYDGRPDTWIGMVIAGEDVCQGEFFLTSKDLPTSSLPQQQWTGIVLGNSEDMEYLAHDNDKNGFFLHHTIVLIIQEQERKQRHGQGHKYYERIGLLTLAYCPLNGSMLERRTRRVM